MNTTLSRPLAKATPAVAMATLATTVATSAEGKATSAEVNATSAEVNATSAEGAHHVNPARIDALPLVRFDHVSVQRSAVITLDNVCASIPRGGNTVIIGPNGGGKTSLLLCLLHELPHSGRLLITTGESPSSRFSPQNTLRFGYVPQQMQATPGLPLTVTEFLALHLQRRPLWLGVSKAVRTKAAALLESVQAEHLAKHRLGRLSGGELRRVLLASALAREPELLVLDEPAAGVDFQGEQLFWEVLDHARRAQGFTQVMVSHNLPLAAHYATHIIGLNKSVRAEGPPRQALTTATLLDLFGVPIHLYPDHCDAEDPTCPQCGVYGPNHLQEIQAKSMPSKDAPNA